MPAAGKAFLGILALAGLGFYAFSASADEKKPGTGPGASGGGSLGSLPGLEGCTLDSNLPSDYRKMISDFLNKKGLGPADYSQISTAAANAGYPKLAACLAAKAESKNKTAAVEVATRGGMPFVIRYGDIPSHMADYYTGQGGRWKELGPPNPQIGSIQTVNGVTNYSHWNVGTEILIPASWNPLAKPLIAPLGGGGGGAAPAPHPQTPAPAPEPAIPPPGDIHPEDWLPSGIDLSTPANIIDNIGDLFTPGPQDGPPDIKS